MRKDRDEERQRKALVLEIIKSSRNRIYFDLRFLEPAIFRLNPEERSDIFLGSDGEKLYYDKNFLLETYVRSPEMVRCSLLHTIIHCLYQHPFQALGHEENYWDLAADIAVLDVMKEINLPWVQEQIPGVCFSITDELRKEIPLMSAAYITKYLQKQFSVRNELYGFSLADLQNLFQRDSHSCWHRKPFLGTRKPGKEDEEQRQGKRDKGRMLGKKEKGQKQDKGDENQGKENIDQKQGNERNEAENSLLTPVQAKSGTGLGEACKTAQKDCLTHNQGLLEEWKEVAETVMMRSQSFPKTQGTLPDNMFLHLRKLVRENYDYTEFLRKFAVMEERMKVNPDEFDYSYYVYGLRLLKKIPLIEPLEYREEYQIREFVIVIDTSGSCSEGLAQRFLQKTYNILKQTEHFAQKVNIHVIQCDAKVQQDCKIESLQHLENYIHDLQLTGGGGTDFRPAFSYVDCLCHAGAFQKLCGLIYFTDGYGIFPGKPPGYKTAFIFVDRDEDIRVPPWAMRLYLEDSNEDGEDGAV